MSLLEEPMLKIGLGWVIVIIEIIFGLSFCLGMSVIDMYKLRKNGFRKGKKYTYTCKLNEDVKK